MEKCEGLGMSTQRARCSLASLGSAQRWPPISSLLPAQAANRAIKEFAGD